MSSIYYSHVKSVSEELKKCFSEGSFECCIKVVEKLFEPVKNMVVSGNTDAIWELLYGIHEFNSLMLSDTELYPENEKSFVYAMCDFMHGIHQVLSGLVVQREVEIGDIAVAREKACEGVLSAWSRILYMLGVYLGKRDSGAINGLIESISSHVNYEDVKIESGYDLTKDFVKFSTAGALAAVKVLRSLLKL